MCKDCPEKVSKCKVGKCGIDDEPRSGRPVNFDDDILRNFVESETQLIVDQIEERINSSHGTVFHHLKIGKVSKLGKWVLHELSKANCQQRINICTSLLSCFKRGSFLDRLITGDEKLINYHNMTRKRTWTDRDKQPIPTAKVSLHPKKILFECLVGYAWCNLFRTVRTKSND
ncbi:histone-lysine N-methyltransferase SETMAR [Trichonephila clavipes]|nr:histone-lysine N-methyltransferase SETMAR [Trichonephila clavipes]